MLLRTIVAWLAALEGLVLVFVMANVYMLPTEPSWNSWATPSPSLQPLSCWSNGHGRGIRGQLRLFAAETTRLRR